MHKAVNCTLTKLAISVLMIVGSPVLVYSSDPSPRDTYDTPLVVSYKEVARSTKTKTVVAAFTFSIRTSGLPLDEVNIEIDSPERILRVKDFLPQTTTVTDIVDGQKQVVVRRSRGSASISKLEGALLAGAEAKGGTSLKSAAEILVKGSTESQDSENTMIDITYKQLAPRQLLVASGISNRGHGVFFKLKRTSQYEIEGQHKFICLFEVVPTWRCDYLRATCNSSRSKGELLIGVFTDDDSEAKALVEKAATIHERMAPTIIELDSVRSSTLFPYFGLGSKAAEIDRKLAFDRNAYDETLKDIRLLNLQVDSELQ